MAIRNGLRFQVQIEDLGLKWRILGINSKNNISGSTKQKSPANFPKAVVI
jgi:hypothetical protein